MKTKLGKLNKLTKGSSRKYDKSKFKYDPKVKTEVNANGYKVNLPGYFEKTGKQGITRDRTKRQQVIRDVAAGVKQGKRKVTKHVVKNKGKYITGASVAVAGAGIAAKKKYDNSKTVKGRIKKAIGR